MYRYLFVECKVGGLWGKSDNHRDEIEKYVLQGWRFVASIPKSSSGNGLTDFVDLVFEKEEKNN